MRRFISLYYLALFCTLLVLGGLAGCSLNNSQVRSQAGDDPDPGFDLNLIKTVRDAADVDNALPIQVSGVGLVSGLEGTGGAAPNGLYRKMLEDELRRARVENIKELLSSPNYSMVLISGNILAGAHKGDPFDIEVTLPTGSRATSLRGGILHECYLRDYASTKSVAPNYPGSDKLLGGHILGKAKGPLIAAEGDGDPAANARRARIWDGGVSFIDRPFYLVLKNDKKFASVAAGIADRINMLFPDDPVKRQHVLERKRLFVLDEVQAQLNNQFKTAPLGRRETAKAFTKEIVTAHVPDAYRLNPERFLRVAMLIPLREAPEVQGRYRAQLERNLMDPGKTLTAALRLEALGRESMPILQKGLQHANPLVRFACAESLCYLGSAAGADELANLVQNHGVLQVYCLTALAGLDENISREKLTDLLSCPIPQVRFGAFRGLRVLDEWSPELHGELLGDVFWVHRVAPNSTPMVAYATSRRAEIVCFGDDARLVAPFKILAGSEYTITAERGDDRCTVSRFTTGAIQRKQCNFRLPDVLRTMAMLGAQYNDAVALLRELDHSHALSCPVMVDPLPDPVSVEFLAAAGDHHIDAKQFPMVERIREDLGATPSLYSRGSER